MTLTMFGGVCVCEEYTVFLAPNMLFFSNEYEGFFVGFFPHSFSHLFPHNTVKEDFVLAAGIRILFNFFLSQITPVSHTCFLKNTVKEDFVLAGIRFCFNFFSKIFQFQFFFLN